MNLRSAAAALFATLVLAVPAHGQQRNIDLREPHALESLRASDPAAYENIRRIINGLTTTPSLAAGNWLQVNFNARNVDLSRLIYRTSFPPVQLLQFSLGDTRYTLYVRRTDLKGRTDRLGGAAEPNPKRHK
jgi:hypothetical protein